MRTTWYEFQREYVLKALYDGKQRPPTQETIAAFQKKCRDDEDLKMKDLWKERVVMYVSIEDIPEGHPIVKRLYEWMQTNQHRYRGGYISVWLNEWRMVPVYKQDGPLEAYINWRDRIETFTADGSIKYLRQSEQRQFQIVMYTGGPPPWTVPVVSVLTDDVPPVVQRRMMTRAMARMQRARERELSCEDSDGNEI